MKRFTKLTPLILNLIAFCAIVGFSITNANARTLSKLDAKFVVAKNDGTDYWVTIQVKCDSSGKHLGASTFILTYNTTNLKWHNAATGGGTNNTDYSWSTGFGNSNNSAYSTSSKPSQPSVGTIYVVLDYTSDRYTGVAATAISTSFGDLITLKFKTQVTSGNSDLQWAMNHAVTDSLDDVFDDQLDDVYTDPASLNYNAYFHYDYGTFTNLNTSPLPVTLLNFSAFLDNYQTILKWSTATEFNNAYFTVERSADGVNFEPIITKSGSDNSNVRKDYLAYDDNPLTGTSYYRLKQTDYNGRSTTFNIVTIHNGDVGTFAINYITPANSGNTPLLNYTMPMDAEVRMVVTSLNGTLVADNMLFANKGDNSFKIDNASDWKPGLYIVNLVYDGRSVSTKMVKN